MWITPLDSLCPTLNESFVKVDLGPASDENTDNRPSPSSPTIAVISQVCLEHWHISEPKSHFPFILVILHVGSFVSITWNHKGSAWKLDWQLTQYQSCNWWIKRRPINAEKSVRARHSEIMYVKKQLGLTSQLHGRGIWIRNGTVMLTRKARSSEHRDDMG